MGFPVLWAFIALGLVAFMGGLLAIVFLKKFQQHAAVPAKDPRLIEAMGLYHPVATPISGGEIDEADTHHSAPVQPERNTLMSSTCESENKCCGKTFP